MVPARNEGEHLARTVGEIRRTMPPASEIIVVDDGSIDGSADAVACTARDDLRLVRAEGLGAAGARNYGARLAEGNILVFLDAHMTLPQGWLEPLLDLVRRPEIGAAAPGIAVMGAPGHCGFGLRWTSPSLAVDWLPPPSSEAFAAPLLPGCALVMRRPVFTELGGFDDGLVSWGSEDAELSLRLWLLGFEQRIHPGSVVEHLFRDRHPYALSWDLILHNQLRVAAVHFSERRLSAVLAATRGQPGFERAMARLLAGDAAFRRRSLALRRIHDDDWFFIRFGDLV